jgi:hypothetical protein
MHSLGAVWTQLADILTNDLPAMDSEPAAGAGRPAPCTTTRGESVPAHSPLTDSLTNSLRNAPHNPFASSRTHEPTCYSLPHSLTHSLTRELIHSHTDLLTHSLTYELVHSHTHSQTHSVTRSITNSITHPLTRSLTQAQTISTSRSLIHSCANSLTHSLSKSVVDGKHPVDGSSARRLAHPLTAKSITRALIKQFIDSCTYPITHTVNEILTNESPALHRRMHETLRCGIAPSKVHDHSEKRLAHNEHTRSLAYSLTL